MSLNDERQPGNPWQTELEEQIGTVTCAAIMVGGSDLGPWQNAETRAFLNEFMNRGCPVIPVLLPEAGAIPDLPIFLKQMTWVDLRKEYDQNFRKLVTAIKSRR